MKKSPESTSLRSETQATDSTCSGWTAKTAATKALRPTPRVMRASAKKSTSVAAAWSARLPSR